MDTRIPEAQRILEERGVEGAEIRATGVAGEIAAVKASFRYAARIAEIAPELRTLGFHFVALDLDDGEGPGHR